MILRWSLNLNFLNTRSQNCLRKQGNHRRESLIFPKSRIDDLCSPQLLKNQIFSPPSVKSLASRSAPTFTAVLKPICKWINWILPSMNQLMLLWKPLRAAYLIISQGVGCSRSLRALRILWTQKILSWQKICRCQTWEQGTWLRKQMDPEAWRRNMLIIILR